MPPFCLSSVTLTTRYGHEANVSLRINEALHYFDCGPLTIYMDNQFPGLHSVWVNVIDLAVIQLNYKQKTLVVFR